MESTQWRLFCLLQLLQTVNAGAPLCGTPHWEGSAERAHELLCLAAGCIWTAVKRNCLTGMSLLLNLFQAFLISILPMIKTSYVQILLLRGVVLWDVGSCSVLRTVPTLRISMGLHLFFCLEDGGSKFLRSVGKLPDYTVSNVGSLVFIEYFLESFLVRVIVLLFYEVPVKFAEFFPWRLHCCQRKVALNWHRLWKTPFMERNVSNGAKRQPHCITDIAGHKTNNTVTNGQMPFRWRWFFVCVRFHFLSTNSLLGAQSFLRS
jgi:hypothetical protein